ncbi:MAG: hypothetical protein QM820_31810 [Minicystis sp.]
MIRRALLLALPVTAVVLGGCEKGLTDPAALPDLDEAYFRCHVQPILSKNCATFACHGTADRYYRLFARNRLRYGISGEDQRNSPLNDAERKHNYDATRGFVDVDKHDDSLILRKPLESDAGGYYHGATKLGTSNVFPTIESAEYKVILKWIQGEKEKDQQCIEPGSEL